MAEKFPPSPPPLPKSLPTQKKEPTPLQGQTNLQQTNNIKKAPSRAADQQLPADFRQELQQRLAKVPSTAKYEIEGKGTNSGASITNTPPPSPSSSTHSLNTDKISQTKNTLNSKKFSSSPSFSSKAAAGNVIEELKAKLSKREQNSSVSSKPLPPPKPAHLKPPLPPKPAHLQGKSR